MKEIIKKIIPPFLLSWYHFSLAFLAAIFYRFPSRKIKIIGVTGTNGKTTVVNFTAKILESAGFKTAALSSIKFKIGGQEKENTLKMTMPGRFKLQKFLRQAADQNCRYAVLEVSSEGIKQYRHKFIRFEAAVFTNLSPEHIESHGSFDNYRTAKGKLFKETKKIHIINIDDKNAEYFLDFPAEKKYTYGLNQGVVKNKDMQFNLKMPGDFNIYNALAAVSVGLSQGIDLNICRKAVEEIKGIPGRMEEVISRPFKAIVDYAVTPDALEQAYKSIKKLFAPRKLICVFGSCGGGRDKWKRPILGEIAAKYCHKIIITNEDPYDENPMEIIEQIAKGAESFSVNQPLGQHKAVVYKILDRREAIKKSLELAQPGDVIIITGKGCEPWICFANNRKIPWDDRKVVKEEFELINDKKI